MYKIYEIVLQILIIATYQKKNPFPKENPSCNGKTNKVKSQFHPFSIIDLANQTQPILPTYSNILVCWYHITNTRKPTMQSQIKACILSHLLQWFKASNLRSLNSKRA